MKQITKTAMLGTALVAASLLAGCAYDPAPAPGPYGYNYGYDSSPYAPAGPDYYGSGADYYGYGYGYGPDYGYGGPAVYGEYDGGYYNQNRDWHRDHAGNADRRYDPNHPTAFNRDRGDRRYDSNHPAAFNRNAPAARPAEIGARNGNPTMLRPQSEGHSIARTPEGGRAPEGGRGGGGENRDNRF